MTKYTEENIGDIVTIERDSGTLIDERIVMVYCQVCAARYIGPIREAGGFLGGHEVFHTWEFKVEMETALEA